MPLAGIDLPVTCMARGAPLLYSTAGLDPAETAASKTPLVLHMHVCLDRSIERGCMHAATWRSRGSNRSHIHAPPTFHGYETNYCAQVWRGRPGKKLAARATAMDLESGASSAGAAYRLRCNSTQYWADRLFKGCMHTKAALTGALDGCASLRSNRGQGLKLPPYFRELPRCPVLV